MPYPNLDLAMTKGYSDHIISSYIAQLHLRGNLNKIYRELYDPEPRSANVDLMNKVDEIQLGLERVKNIWVPERFHFTEHNPPVNDILSARLRAKYWESQVMIYRPFVKMVLGSQPGPPSPWILHAQLGITALVQYTRAFHGIGSRQRIIVTSIFTTAHVNGATCLF